MKDSSKYLLLTEFEPYRKLPTEFFSFAKRLGYKSKGKKRGSVTYSTDREDEVSKIFFISLFPSIVCMTGSATIQSIDEERLSSVKYLKQVESKTSQFEIVFKSLARFSTQFRAVRARSKSTAR